MTRFYDPVLRFTLRERTFKSELIRQANIQPGQRVLDLGCGTATLTLLVKQRHPESEVVGLDGDAKVLALARAKAERAGAHVEFKHGLSFALDFPDASFDRVVSSLLFHHLTLENKLQTFAEVRRVLRPDGELHVADWGRARNAWMRTAFLAIQLLDGFATTTDNVRGRLPELMTQAGLQGAQETRAFSTVFGTLSLYRAGVREITN